MSVLRGAHASGRAKSIEPGGIIRPVRIAEKGPAARLCVSRYGGPNGVGEVRARFDHDDQIAGPSDVEAEVVGANTKAGAAGLNH